MLDSACVTTAETVGGPDLMVVMGEILGEEADTKLHRGTTIKGSKPAHYWVESLLDSIWSHEDRGGGLKVDDLRGKRT